MKDIFDIFPVKRTRKKQNKICELPHFPINMLSLLWHLPKSNIIKFSLLHFWKSSCNMNIKLIDGHHIEPYSEYVGVNYFSIIACIFFRIFLQYMWADVLLNVTEKNILSDDEVCTVKSVQWTWTVVTLIFIRLNVNQHGTIILWPHLKLLLMVQSDAHNQLSKEKHHHIMKSLFVNYRYTPTYI